MTARVEFGSAEMVDWNAASSATSCTFAIVMVVVLCVVGKVLRLLSDNKDYGRGG
jgi:hypothetical protein